MGAGECLYLGCEARTAQNAGHQHITRLIFISQENALGNRRADDAVQTPLSFTVRSCSHNGLRYFVIGDASPQNLDKLSGLIKAAS